MSLGYDPDDPRYEETREKLRMRIYDTKDGQPAPRRFKPRPASAQVGNHKL